MVLFTNIFLGELVGTFVLVLLGDGVVAAVLLNKSKAQNSGWIVITTGWGLAVMMGVFAAQAFGSAGAHINPIVTVAFMLLGSVTFGDAMLYFSGQFLGAFLAAVTVWLAYYRHYEETEDADLKLLTFSTMPAISDPIWNTVTEAIGSFMLIGGIYMIAVQNSPNYGSSVIPTGLFPFLIGGLVWSIGLSLGGPTGYAINPARDLGPRIAHFLLPIPGKRDSGWNYAWVPIVGPIIGAIIAWIFGMMFGVFIPKNF